MPSVPPSDEATAIESELAPPATPRRMSSRPPLAPDDADALHFQALRAAGLCSELTDAMIMVLQERVGPKEQDSRRLDLLEHYYDAGGDATISDRRWAADRMVLFRVDNGATARNVVNALASSYPELAPAVLERIGGADGPLIIRSGDHVSVVDDEFGGDAARETSQLHASTVTVRALVAAYNVIIHRAGEPRRLVPLRGDGKREMYVALDAEAAIPLCLAGHLEEMSTNELMSIANW